MLSHPATLAAFGFVVGAIGSLVGVGGGFLMVPYFMLALGWSRESAVGTSLGVIVANSASAALGYARQKRVDWLVGIVLGLASVPGTWLGRMTNQRLEGIAFHVAFATITAVAAVVTVSFRAEDRPGLAFFRRGARRAFVDASGRAFDYAINLWTAALASVAIGFLSALFGVGGGFLHVPLLVVLYGVPAHVAVATSTLALVLTTGAGAAVYAQSGRVEVVPLLYAGVGALAGAQVGSWMASKLSGRSLKWALAGVLLAAAVLMVWRGLTPPASRI